MYSHQLAVVDKNLTVSDAITTPNSSICQVCQVKVGNVLCSSLLLVCRSNYGDYFGITVAGYPEAHPEVITDDAKEMEKAYQSDLQYLKEKVNSLGSFCIATQV